VKAKGDQNSGEGGGGINHGLGLNGKGGRPYQEIKGSLYKTWHLQRSLNAGKEGAKMRPSMVPVYDKKRWL